jgi:hypothetical protein
VKRTTYKTILVLSILLVTLTCLNSILKIKGEKVALIPTFGQSPTIDGKIDTSTNEWDDALKTSITLYQNLSDPNENLKVDFWMMQDDNNLYIAIQVEFEYHSSSQFLTEFVGILISNNNPGDPPEFKDAKILQFSNISAGEFSYRDYYINGSTYHLDEKSNGTGAAALSGDTSVYEFSLPVDVFDPSHQDVYLGHLYTCAFGVVYGLTPSYPEGIIFSNYELVKIQIPPLEKPSIDWNLILFVLTIIIFGVIGILFGFYVYRIFKLKDKIRRLRG